MTVKNIISLIYPFHIFFKNQKMNNKSEWNIVSRIKKIKNISNNNIIISDKNTLIMQDPVNYINFK